MPDRYKDEETETRTLSLCLFDVAGITVLNRCANCPGAARAALQHRRCPWEPLQPNIFRPEDADSKISVALKSLASSSKRLESGHHETDTVLPDSLARMSLVDSDGTDGTFGRSESDPDVPGDRAESSGTPRIHHGVKRKAKPEDREESSSLAKSKYKRNEYDHLSVPDYLKLRALKPFQDLESGNLYMPGCLRVPSDEMTALLNSSAASPMDMQEDRPSGEASSSRPFVAGCCINTELDGYGLLACNDGIETEECVVLACPDEMEI